MIELSLLSVKNIKNIIDVFSPIVSTITFDFNEDGFIISSVDPSHISLFYVNFNKENVLKYSCSKPQKCVLYVKTLQTILHTAENDDEIYINIDSGEIEKMQIFLQSKERIHKYEVPLLNDDSEILEPGELEYNTEFTLSSRTFYQTCNTFSKICSEDIVISSKSNEIYLKGISDMCSSEIVFKDDNFNKEDLDYNDSNSEYEYTEEEEEEDKTNADDIKEIESKSKSKPEKEEIDEESVGSSSFVMIKNHEDNFEVSFSLLYIQTVSKLHSITNKVKICVSENIPLLVLYEFDEGEAQFYIAPKIME